MIEGENGINQAINPQEIEVNSKNQFYADSLQESNVHSVVSHTSPQNLLKFFQNYQPTISSIDMAALHASQHLKLKKYKEAVYYGQFINGKRHGIGIMIYDSSRVYEGNWECDYKHGQGHEKFPNQCVYVGMYVNGKPEGVGRYSWPNGEFYEGQWMNGLKQGSGMWRGCKGDSYIGEWKFGKAEGYGVHTWLNGDRYEGEFKDCLKHGEGIEKFANGDIYKGNYANGKPNGFGEYYWANGSYFKGNFKNGLRDGQGIWKRGSGNSDKYEGQYANDKKSGFGIFTWASGNIYKGNYNSDLRHGYGEMFWSDRSFYKGEWKDGIQHGNGEIYVPGEGYKRGEFENNVLVVLEYESQTPNEANFQYQTNDPQKQLEKSFTKSNSKKRTLPSKVSFRSRGVQGNTLKNKPQPRENRSINENIVVRYGKEIKDFSGHPLLPKKFNKSREQKYVTLERKSIKSQHVNKDRILHSSFYMHKLYNRDSSAQGSRAAHSGHSGYEGTQSNKKQIIEQMRSYTKTKANKDFRFQV